jgi:hypothetical protein
VVWRFKNKTSVFFLFFTWKSSFLWKYWSSFFLFFPLFSQLLSGMPARTPSYSLVLPSYFLGTSLVLPRTSSYFLVLPRTSWYCLVLPRTPSYSPVLPRTPFVLREYGSLAFSPLEKENVYLQTSMGKTATRNGLVFTANKHSFFSSFHMLIFFLCHRPYTRSNNT